MKHHQLTEATVCRFHELTKVEIIVWCYIKASDPFCSAAVPGPTAIARATGLGKSSVSEALKSLKSKNWSVRADEPSVRADEPSVRIHEPNVRADEHIVRTDEHSTAETLSVNASQDSPDLKDLKQKKTLKEEPEVKVFPVKQPNSQRPILRHQRRAPGPGPSIAAEILARGVTGTSTDPWPAPQKEESLPLVDSTAQRLVAKWKIPALRHQVRAECSSLGIACGADGPELGTLETKSA